MWTTLKRIIKAGFKVGTVWPFVLINCGRTTSMGQPAVGHAMASPDVPGVIIE